MTTEDTQWLRPSPRLLSLWRGISAVIVAVLTAVLAVAAGLLVGVAAAAAAIAAGGVLLAVLWMTAARRYRAWGYAERADDLLVRRGVVLRRLSVVPYGRMQFVDVTSGPLDRRLGLATVFLHTAAAATDARIPGLVQAEATRLRDRLTALGEARAAGL